jgi:hypothetical protein
VVSAAPPPGGISWSPRCGSEFTGQVGRVLGIIQDMATKRQRRVRMLLYFVVATLFCAAGFVELRINPGGLWGAAAILGLLAGEFAAVALVIREGNQLKREDAERAARRPDADD